MKRRLPVAQAHFPMRRGGERINDGELVRSTEEPPHKCKPPQLFTDTGERAADGVPVLDILPAGTRFYCDCGLVHVVWWKPSKPGRPSGPAWRTETFWEAFKRGRSEGE